MQVELKANGKTVQVEITEEQLKETVLFEQLKRLGLIEERSRTGYERVKKGEMYYVVDTEYNSMSKNTEFNDQRDEQCYNTGNYYNDKVIAENNARADRLLRQLRQWQAQNDKAISISDWKNDKINKYCIAYNYSLNELITGMEWRLRRPNAIYFSTFQKTEEAIEVFRDELLWYFTKYQQRLDEEQGE